jgi:hypothetical protein
MPRSLLAAQALLIVEDDQASARAADLERLLTLLRPLAGSRGPAWLVLWRRLPPEQRAEVRDLRARLRVRR